MRVAAWYARQRDQSFLHELSRWVQEILKEDLRCRASTVGMELEALLAYDTPLAKEAWIRM